MAGGSRGTRWGVALPALLACAMAAGCSDQPEGVLLIITADEGLEADKLRVAFAADVPDAVIFDFPIDPNSVQVQDRLGDGGLTDFGDLHEEPFRYFLRGTIPEPTNVVVIAARVDLEPENQLSEIGVEAITVRSEPGVVRQYEVHLQKRPSLAAFESCFHFLADDDRDVIVSFDGDVDCDGATENDCAPLDGRIHPDAPDFCEVGEPIDNNCNGFCDEDEPADEDGRASACGTLINSPTCERSCGPRTTDAVGEICDGQDTDCNPLTLPHISAAPCFVAEELECMFGVKACSDFDDGGAFGDCSPLRPEPLPSEFCDAQLGCADGPGWVECVYGNLQVPIETVHCQLPVTRFEHKACLVEVPVRSDVAQAPCEITVFDLREAGDTSLFEPQSGCLGKLILSTPDVPVEGSFELLVQQASPALNGPQYRRIIVDAFEVDACDNSANLGGCFGPIDF